MIVNSKGAMTLGTSVVFLFILTWSGAVPGQAAAIVQPLGMSSNVPYSWKSTTKSLVQPSEVLFADKTSDSKGNQYGVVVAAPEHCTRKELCEAFADRRFDSATLPPDAVAFPLAVASGSPVCEQDPVKVLEAIDNLSVKHAVISLPSQLPHDVDETVISLYRDSWMAEVQRWMTFTRESEVDAYHWVFREMLTRYSVDSEEVNSIAVAVNKAMKKAKEATKPFALSEDELSVLALKLDTISADPWAEFSLSKYGLMSKTVANLYKIDKGLTCLRAATLTTRGAVFAFAPAIAIDENCDALESLLPCLSGPMKEGAERALHEARNYSAEWLLRTSNWLKQEGIKEAAGMAVSQTLKLLSKEAGSQTVKEFLTKIGANAGAASAVVDVMFGVYVSWSAASALNNLDEIVTEMDRAYYASQIQEQVESHLLAIKRKVTQREKNGLYPDQSELDDARACIRLYSAAGANSMRHISSAFHAQDTSIMGKLARLLDEPDNLSENYASMAIAAEKYADGWCWPRNVSILYLSYWNRLTVSTPTRSSVVQKPSIIFVIDRSGSITGVRGVMEQIQQDANEFANAITKHNARAAVINFSGPGECCIDADLTSDVSVLKKAIAQPSVGHGSTALYDAIITAVDRARTSGEQPMLVVLSDGMNNSSQASLEKAIATAMGAAKHSIPVMAVGYVGFSGRNDNDLRKLAEKTGGWYYDSERLDVQLLLEKASEHFREKKAITIEGEPE